MRTSPPSSSPLRPTKKSLFFWAVKGNLKIQFLLLLIIGTSPGNAEANH